MFLPVIRTTMQPVTSGLLTSTPNAFIFLKDAGFTVKIENVQFDNAIIPYGTALTFKNVVTRDADGSNPLDAADLVLSLKPCPTLQSLTLGDMSAIRIVSPGSSSQTFDAVAPTVDPSSIDHTSSCL